MSNFVSAENVVVPQAIDENSTTQNHPLGTIVRAKDIATTALGEGEFIYLQGIGSTIVGSLVTYNVSHVTALATSTVGVSNPHAVAMAATVASEFGWYQIGGLAVMGKANTLSLAASAPIASASGLVIDVATSNRLQSALVAVVASAKSDVTTVKVMIDRPACGASD